MTRKRISRISTSTVEMNWANSSSRWFHEIGPVDTQVVQIKMELNEDLTELNWWTYKRSSRRDGWKKIVSIKYEGWRATYFKIIAHFISKARNMASELSEAIQGGTDWDMGEGVPRPIIFDHIYTAENSAIPFHQLANLEKQGLFLHVSNEIEGVIRRRGYEKSINR